MINKEKLVSFAILIVFFKQISWYCMFLFWKWKISQNSATSLRKYFLKYNATDVSRTYESLHHSETALNLEYKMRKNKEKMPIIDYIYNQIQNLNQIPLLVLCKSILIMTDDLYLDLINITWELLLNSDQEIAGASGLYTFLI